MCSWGLATATRAAAWAAPQRALPPRPPALGICYAAMLACAPARVARSGRSAASHEGPPDNETRLRRRRSRRSWSPSASSSAKQSSATPRSGSAVRAPFEAFTASPPLCQPDATDIARLRRRRDGADWRHGGCEQSSCKGRWRVCKQRCGQGDWRCDSASWRRQLPHLRYWHRCHGRARHPLHAARAPGATPACCNTRHSLCFELTHDRVFC